VEGEIREFVRRDIAARRVENGAEAPPIPRRDNGAEATPVPRRAEPNNEPAGNFNALIQRVAGTSVQEIDRLISELQTLREFLHNEGNRIQRDIANYAHLSQSAMKSTKVIAENMTLWKSAMDGVRREAQK
jgi:hypothetical protein